MNVADLYVNLGIKGADKTVGALSDVKKGMGELTSMSIEAKAAILGAMYGLERLMSVSGASGTHLTNLSEVLNMNKKSIQQWDYAARQAGVSADEMEGSLKGVQNSMTNMLLGKGAPEGMQMISKAVGGIDINRVRDTGYMMGKLQEAAQKLPKDVGNTMLKSFGLSEGTIAAMRRNAFTSDVMNKAPTYSDKEIGNLDKSNIAWSNLSHHIEMAFGHLNAKHGQELVADITKVADAVIKMLEAFMKLAEALKLFQVLGKVFDGWAKIFGGVSNAVSTISKDKGGALHGLMKEGGGILHSLGQAGQGAYLTGKEALTGNNSTTTNINQNIVHHGNAKDTQAVGQTHKAAVNHAFRQRGSIRAGS